METCCCLSRSGSYNHYEEDYEYKSKKYLIEEKNSLNKRICRERCFCCIYTTATITTTITTFTSKGISSPLTVPSAVLAAAHMDKSRRDLAVLIKEKMQLIIFKKNLINRIKIIYKK